MPTLATPTSKPQLHFLNAAIKRIDLKSKLVGPIFISLAVMTVESLVVLALVVAGMNSILSCLSGSARNGFEIPALSSMSLDNY